MVKAHPCVGAADEVSRVNIAAYGRLSVAQGSTAMVDEVCETDDPIRKEKSRIELEGERAVAEERGESFFCVRDQLFRLRVGWANIKERNVEDKRRWGRSCRESCR